MGNCDASIGDDGDEEDMAVDSCNPEEDPYEVSAPPPKWASSGEARGDDFRPCTGGWIGLGGKRP